MTAYADYPSADGAHKLLTDNRDFYIAQSAATKDGDVADFREVRESQQRPD